MINIKIYGSEYSSKEDILYSFDVGTELNRGKINYFPVKETYKFNNELIDELSEDFVKQQIHEYFCSIMNNGYSYILQKQFLRCKYDDILKKIIFLEK